MMVYWNYATYIIPVCFTAMSPTTLKPNVRSKSNFQIRPGSTAMGRFYEFLCYNYLQFHDPLLDELLSYLPNLFPSHIFDYIVDESSDDEAHHSDSTISAFYSDDSTYFLKTICNAGHVRLQSSTNRQQNLSRSCPTVWVLSNPPLPGRPRLSKSD